MVEQPVTALPQHSRRSRLIQVQRGPCGMGRSFGSGVSTLLPLLPRCALLRQVNALLGKHLPQSRDRGFEGIPGLGVLCGQPELSVVILQPQMDVYRSEVGRIEAHARNLMLAPDHYGQALAKCARPLRIANSLSWTRQMQRRFPVRYGPIGGRIAHRDPDRVERQIRHVQNLRPCRICLCCKLLNRHGHGRSR